MTQSPFHVSVTRTGTCFECGRSVEAKPHGVKLRLVGEHTLGTVILCRECFARAIATADRGGAPAAPEIMIRRECQWAAPNSPNCGHPAVALARATRKDGSAVADLALCEEHLTSFKLWWHDHAITMQRLSAPQESAEKA